MLKLDFGEQVGREDGRIPFLASGPAKKKEGRAEYVLAPSGPYIPHIHARLFLKAVGGEGEKVEKTDGVISPPPLLPLRWQRDLLSSDSGRAKRERRCLLCAKLPKRGLTLPGTTINYRGRVPPQEKKGRRKPEQPPKKFTLRTLADTGGDVFYSGGIKGERGGTLPGSRRRRRRLPRCERAICASLNWKAPLLNSDAAI